MDGLIGCDDLSVKVKDISDERELVKIINVVGQEVNIDNHRREVLFYIYNDGSVQKENKFLKSYSQEWSFLFSNFLILFQK